jgi:hypothetical protein
MSKIIIHVVKGLATIPAEVLRDIGNEIFFPRIKYAPVDEAQKRILRQQGLIRSLQDDLSGQASKSNRHQGQVTQLYDLLVRKDKQIEQQRIRIKSLEFALQNERDRIRRIR